MNPLSIIAIMLSTSALFAGFYVLGLNRKELSNLLFCMICLTIAGWLFCAAMSYSAPTEADVVFWFHAAALFYIPFAAFNLHFYHELTHPGVITPASLPALYIPVPLMITVNFSGIGPYNHFSRIGNMWKVSTNSQGWGFYIISAYMIISIALSMILIFQSALTNDDKKKRLHSRVLSFFLSLTLILALMTGFVLPCLRSYPFPQIGVIWLGFYILAIYLNVFRYRFLGRRIMIPAEDLILQMEDFGLLLNPDGTIQTLNPALSRRLELEKQNWKDLNIRNLLEVNNFSEWLSSSDVVKSKTVHRGSLTFSTPKGPLATEATLTAIFDRQGELEAFLILAKENAKKQEFIRRYKVTSREMQVLEGCMRGSNNSEIAVELGMSVRTVETHLVHLYNKLGINSKIEMIQIAVSFQLNNSKII